MNIKITELDIEDADAIINTQVKPFGNSCHIPVPKKYEDQYVKIIFLKNREIKDENKNNRT